MGTENMKICIVSFTKKGYELSCDIAYKLEKSEYEVEAYVICRIGYGRLMGGS